LFFLERERERERERETGTGEKENRPVACCVGDHLLANGFCISHNGGSGEELGVVLHVGMGAGGGAAMMGAGLFTEEIKQLQTLLMFTEEIKQLQTLLTLIQTTRTAEDTP